MAKSSKTNPFRSFLETTEPEPEQSTSSPEVELAPSLPGVESAPEVEPLAVPEIKKPQPQPQPVAEVATPSKKRGRQPGKRSNPDYIQVGAYIPKALDKAVKRKLLDEDLDFSDLVNKLLTDWLSD